MRAAFSSTMALSRANAAREGVQANGDGPLSGGRLTLPAKRKHLAEGNKNHRGK
jgi:hypothetical protein